MGKPQSHIVFNGKVYDIKTSHTTTSHPDVKPKVYYPTPKPAPLSAPKPIPVHDGQAIDGVVRHRPHAHRSQAPSAHKAVQKSKTLMRSAVRKPAAHKAEKHHSVTKPVTINPHRLTRAHHTPQSHLISRFGVPHTTSIAPQVTPLAVQSPPDTAAPPVLPDHFESAVVSIPKNHKVSHANPFERALSQANSHNQPQHKLPSRTHRIAHRTHTSPKVVRAAAVAILLLGVGGFFVHQNIPHLAMNVAGKRAGVAARLPGYQPAGFSLAGAIEYSPGQIEVSYKSNSDDRNFRIAQKATELTQTTISPTRVLGASTDYQTIMRADKVIYMDSQNKATWVENGVLYEIDGKDLSNDQLLRVIDSL